MWQLKPLRVNQDDFTRIRCIGALVLNHVVTKRLLKYPSWLFLSSINLISTVILEEEDGKVKIGRRHMIQIPVIWSTPA